jgi:opacity protein-like surface antigen
MKTCWLVAATWIAGSGLAIAQAAAPPGSIPRADLHVVVGWQNLHKEQPQTQTYSNDWLNGIFYGAAGAGWYWTDNLKTQVDFGGGTRANQYRYEYTTVNGRSTSTSSRLRVQQQSLAVGQQYQFFRNQWFHPHVGAGIDVARETTSEIYEATFVFDNINHTSTQLAPRRSEGPEHDILVRPFVEAGFKAYMTRRAFFTGDSRVMVRHGLDEVLFRFGFGVDF